MAMLDKAKVQESLTKFNATLAAEGKTLQEAADAEKTKALEKMQALHKDPQFAKNRG